ncbi:hypothetical protein H0E87_013600 [Populus deltoides]|uniref:BED-type domain-containing protein n=1 Tax=Populus deltoides TaxID=3696 RepID=A0A8T2YP88_POPDE|nr:hypothetical protein H0E87_013600 [Populus deltoides]
MQQDLDVITAKQNSQQLKIQEEESDAHLPLSDVGMFSNPFSNFESAPGMRRKKDVGWKHCEMLKNEKRVQIKCNYCAKLFKGGGIHRFKEHLAGRNSGGVPSCTRVPPDVRDLMEQHLSPIVVRQRKKRKSKREKLDDVDSPPGGEDVYIFADYSDDMITPLRAVAACNLVEVNSDFLLDGEGTSNGNLGTRKSAIAVAASDDADALIAMGSETADNPIHAIWGRFLYDIGASLDAMDSNFSQPLIDTVAYGRPGIAAPSHQDLRGRILKSLVEEVKADWWSIYGGSCPNLARLAIRILSQTCSAIGCSHNHIPFEKVHRTRNFLQRQRLTDLVFVQYNLRLRQMVDGNKKQIPEDPISFDDVSLVEDWITQNELCLEDSGSSDWMSLVPRSVNTMPLAPSTDESEDVASGNCLAMLKNVSSQLLFLIKLNALVCMQGLMILRSLMDRRMFKMRNGDDEVNHGEFILMAGYVFHHMLALEKGIVMFEAMNRN